ncbi:MAG TPA: orotidine-5'-phosphate decarboxylase [Burkholderiaceae bacterium]|jgi:orotidine-5'-phosphate decarboxylase|nr:orotidine-5'-phosphate decarboxylase [Burkholderiaceae bacterium]
MSNAPAPFLQRLSARWSGHRTLLCVGLDPDPARLPRPLAGRPDALFEFCRDIVDATADLACAFKPQLAYFAAHRAEDQLEALIGHIRARHHEVPVILDAKVGDIGPTAEQYAREAFERYRADAVTLSPLMGLDSIEPFLRHPEHGAFLLCRTSNPGGTQLQMLDVGGERLYERIARLAVSDWNVNGQLGLVVGATYPQELARVRVIAPRLPLLVPGIGAQGGDIDATLRAGLNPDGAGLVISSSRAILYAGSEESFALQARQVAIETRDRIEAVRSALRPD